MPGAVSLEVSRGTVVSVLAEQVLGLSGVFGAAVIVNSPVAEAPPVVDVHCGTASRSASHS